MGRIKTENRSNLPDDLLAANIRKLRKQAGITLKEMASQIGISTSIISKYEAGSLVPSGERLDEMARVIGAKDRTIYYGFQAEEEYHRQLSVNFENVTPAEQRFLYLLMKLDNAGRRKAEDYLNLLHASHMYDTPEEARIYERQKRDEAHWLLMGNNYAGK